MNSKLRTSLAVAFVAVLLLATVLSACSPAQPSPASPAQPPKATSAQPPTIIPKPTAQPAAPPAKSEYPVPAGVQMLGHATFPSGMTSYMTGAAIFDSFQRTTGITTRIIPYPTGVARFGSLREGTTHCGVASTTMVYGVQNSLDEFKEVGWGPLDLRMVWGGGIVTYATLTPLKGFEKLEPPKGFVGLRTDGDDASPFARKLLTSAALGFFGLKREDFKIIGVKTESAAMKSIVEGRSDIYVNAPIVSPATYEMEASSGGIRWYGYDPADKEGWNRALSVVDTVFPYKVKAGEGPAVKSDLWTMGVANYYVAVASLNDDIAFTLSKGIWNSYETYKDMHPALKDYTREMFVDYKLWTIPYHPGSIRFLKQIGKWTADHDKYQEQALKKIEDQKKAWQAAKK